MREVGLVLVIGAPGIGKSTFCRNLHRFIWSMSNQSQSQHMRSFLISYDDLMDQSIEKQVIEEMETNEWKSLRQFILKLVQVFVEFLQQQHLMS